MRRNSCFGVKNQAFKVTWLYWAGIVLLIPALLINLGLLAFIDDEGIRSLVAMEMQFSGDYITPTMHGAYYYNKPPLYNWFLLVFFKLFGRFDEFVARFPTVLCLLGYAATVFYFFRKKYSTKVAFLNAFVLITCGRMLFWDSMLGLIDTCFSWVIFTLFMWVYHQFEARKWYALFLGAYFLGALGFLLKGLPSVVFLGFTLLTWFLYKRSFKKLFSLPHILGGLILLLIVGGYYVAYYLKNPDLERVFATLFSESSKRTITNYSVGDTILHVFSFPFEMIYHFLPWTLLVIYYFRKDIKQLILKDDFITYNLLIFLANIILYWTSPEVYPRYVLMLAPLVFSSYIYLHQIHKRENTWQYRFLSKLFLVVCVLIALGSLTTFFIDRPLNIPYRTVKGLALFLGLASLAYLYYRQAEHRLVVLVVFLVVFRIGFDWFVLPDRNQNDYGDECRISATEIGDSLRDDSLFVYGITPYQAATSFYMTRAYGKIVKRKLEDFNAQDYYLIDPRVYGELPYKEIKEVKVRHGELKYYVIGQLPINQ